MTFPKSEFKFIDRGFKDLLVLIPGWATDSRIFSGLNLDYNYLLTTSLYPFDFKKALFDKIEKTEKVSLFGWSLGGFLAAEFAQDYPQKINELILLSIREKFEAKGLEDIKLKLNKNKNTYLYKFYRECFYGNGEEAFNWFKENLLNEYLEKIELKELIFGLNYFASTAICPADLMSLAKIKIFHGKEDQIVSLEEAIKIKSKIPHAEFICLEDAGHLPFLSTQFRKWFYHG